MTTDSKTTAVVDKETLLSVHVVRAVGVKKVYELGDETVHALRGVRLSVNRGEYVSIMGPSGSG
ncbi:MAG: ABC transporter ATP-binding protein, partial [Planctomycetota bacterium]|nr:ABC transporter ATP-binding protein [Planctomycetota bacterium]